MQVSLLRVVLTAVGPAAVGTAVASSRICPGEVWNVPSATLLHQRMLESFKSEQEIMFHGRDDLSAPKKTCGFVISKTGRSIAFIQSWRLYFPMYCWKFMYLLMQKGNHDAKVEGTQLLLGSDLSCDPKPEMIATRSEALHIPRVHLCFSCPISSLNCYVQVYLKTAESPFAQPLLPASPLHRSLLEIVGRRIARVGPGRIR